MSKELEWCNWTFWEVIKRSNRWGISRDCDDTPLVQQKKYGLYDYDEKVTLILSRDSGKNWYAYKASLQPQVQTRDPQPRPSAQCPKCGKQVNGVNPYDDGETWRK
jgi:hypothetical protein